MALAMRTKQQADTSGGRLSAARAAGVFALATSTLGWAGWLMWRVVTLDVQPIAVLSLLLELLGAAVAIVVGVGMAAAGQPRSVYEQLTAASHRFGFAAADTVGRTRAEDLRRDVRVAVRAGRRSLRRPLPDYVMAAVLIDAPRRLAMVLVVTVGLLVGRPPMDLPPLPALAALVIAVSATAVAHCLLSGGRIRVGDRLRWTYSALGEIVVGDDVDGVAPRRWVGILAAAVVLDLAIALRGISDRWTHGLPPMTDEPRLAAIGAALVLLAGAVFTLLTTSSPELEQAHLVPRRIEERTARQSALGAAVCVGLVGLLAGILPGSVDPAHHDPLRVEQITERDSGAGRG
jgi:hypothetical protein